MLSLPPSCAISATFCNRGENGINMQQIGGDASRIVTTAMLKEMQSRASNLGLEAELHDLSSLIDPEWAAARQGQDASVLVLRGFVKGVLGPEAVDQIEHEFEMQHVQGKVDCKALFRGEVKNKNARHNNVLADFDQEPDYAAGKGTVVKLVDYPYLDRLAKVAKDWMSQDRDLVCEQNRYFDVKSCGIGWHGDGERQLVFGARFGEATKYMPMMFQAFHRGEAIGPQIDISLRRGDVYIMSTKAVGQDWKMSSRLTWRHAAGNPGTCGYVVTKAEKTLKRKVAEAKKSAKKSKIMFDAE